VTITDIATAVSSRVARAVTVAEVRAWRLHLAQEYCDRMWDVDQEKACIGNPYLPNSKVGNNYIFTGSRANRLVNMIVSRARTTAKWRQYVPQAEVVSS
jgi:hypothetical protein